MKKGPGGVECLYEFNLLHHVGVVAERVLAAETAHEGDDNTPRGKNYFEVGDLSSPPLPCKIV